jgi:hypothetical protein
MALAVLQAGARVVDDGWGFDAMFRRGGAMG